MVRLGRYTALLLLGVLCVSTASFAQISRVSVSNCGPGGFPATTCTIPATQAGNLLVVAWASSGVSSTNVVSITDNAGNTYAQAGSARGVNTATNEIVDIWYASNIKAGANRVTLTPSPSGQNGAAVIWEFSGVETVNPLGDAAVLNSRPSTSTPTGPNLTVPSGEWLLVSAMVTSGTTSGIRAGNAFTNDSLLIGDGWASLITSTPGTYAAQWNTTAGSYTASAVSFRGRTVVSQTEGNSSMLNQCDLTSNGSVGPEDVQLAANMSLGVAPCTAAILGPNVCNVVVVQRVINAALGGACVVGTPRTVTLNWVASVSPGVTGYNVYRSVTSGGPYTQLNSAPVTATTFDDNVVEAGQTYYYVVKAKDNAGNESGPSNEATAQIPAS